MNDNFFKQGMSHSEAESICMKFDDMGDEAFGNMMDHYLNLPNRPDYDGFVTIEEGVKWAKDHPFALKYPSPENTLYIDSSQLDFGNLSSSMFIKPNAITPINLFNMENVMNSASNNKLRATVYALGRFDAILTSKDNKTITVVNNSAADYDWNEGGSWIRDMFIKVNNLYYNINPNIHGFKTFYYGVGKLNQ